MNATARLASVGARPGGKILTLVHAMYASASHIDHTDEAPRRLSRCGVVASGDGTVDDRDVPAVVHVRALPLDGRRDWSRARTRLAGAGAGTGPLLIDVDSRSASRRPRHE